MGEKEQGLDILQKFNELTKYYTSNDSENLRRRRAREHARDVYQEANLRRHEFFQNCAIASEHEHKIDQIQISKNGKYFTTTSRSCVKFWQLEPEIKLLKTLELEDEEDAVEEKRVLAALDSTCT